MNSIFEFFADISKSTGSLLGYDNSTKKINSSCGNNPQPNNTNNPQPNNTNNPQPNNNPNNPQPNNNTNNLSSIIPPQNTTNKNKHHEKIIIELIIIVIGISYCVYIIKN